MSDKFEGLPVIDADETEKITAAVRIDDMQEGDPNDSAQHPIAIALCRQEDIDDARVTESETLVRRGMGFPLAWNLSRSHLLDTKIPPLDHGPV
jgi:hypothetical protein